jgi:hypothetical protein
MLAHTYRFRVFNNCGQAIGQNNITVTSRRWKVAGGLVYEEAEGSVYVMNAASLATLAYHAGDTLTNANERWFGGDFVFMVTAPPGSNGDIVLFYEISTDGGLTWPDAGAGVQVSGIGFTSSGTKRRPFSL